MPRRKNQSPNATILGRDSLDNKMSQNSDVQLKWRDTTLHELQNMFSGSIDPEVVQLVLSESDYNVNDAVEKLFVLSGIEQGQAGSKTSQDSHPSPSSVSNRLDSTLTKKQKPNIYHDEILSTDQSDLVVDSRFTGSHIGATAMTSKSSSFGNLPSRSSSTVTSTDDMTPRLVYITTGSQHREEVPRTLPSFILPSSPFHSGSNESSQAATSSLCVDSTSSVMSSGLPDFPDNILQQYKTLKKQAKGTGNVERLFPQEPSGRRDLFSDTNGRPSVDRKVPDQLEFSKPSDVNLHDRDQKLKGNLESFVKQMISGNASTEDWKKASNSNSKKQQLDSETSKQGIHNQNTSAAHRSDNKRQVRYNESQRTSNSDLSLQTNSQNLMFSSPSPKVQKTSPIHNTNKPHLPQKANAHHQPPNQSTFNTLPKETMFRPPAIQRQFQPFVPPQGFSQTMPGSAPQPRFALMPAVRSPWQQGPMMQRPMSVGHMPYQYPQGAFPFQPQFSFGRAAAQPVRQAFGVGIPFIPTIHQKLLILVRGLPGSGKSSLAQKLKGVHGVVLSTDDFFYRNQRYDFDVSLLGEAHEWNQQRAKRALEKLHSPVIIDNTNTQCWEMKPYVSMAVKYGYHIKFVEPDTTWKWNVKELARRNQHGVNITAIIKMKERYEHGVTVEKIKNSVREIDANKTGNESETRKGTGADNQNSSPRPQRSPQERGSQDLRTRKVESYGVTSGEKTAAPKLSENDKTSSSQVIKSQTRPTSKEEGFHGLKTASENDVNRVEKSDDNAETGKKEVNSTSVVHDINIGDLVNGADSVITGENDANSSPKPQRVQRIREKRSPNRQQGVNTELPSLDCKDETSVERSGNITSCDSHDGHDENYKPSPMPQRVQRIREKRSPNRQQGVNTELSSLGCEDETIVERRSDFLSCDSHDGQDVNDNSSQGNAREEGTAVFCVEKLSRLASLAASCTFSPAVPSSGNVEDSHAGAEASKVSQTSSSPLSDSPLAGYSSPVLNVSSVESDEAAEATDERVCEAEENDSSEEAPFKEKITCDVEFPERKTSLSHTLTLEDVGTDAIVDSGNDVIKHREPSESNSVPTPPPLSTILASASRTKLKRRSRSNSDPKQPITDTVDSPQGNRLELHLEPNLACGRLDLDESIQSVCDDITTPENNTSGEDVFAEVQNLSNLPDLLQRSSSGDLPRNDISAGVEFLKTCFPDVDSDLINALLTAKSGDMMKVVDELLTSGRAEVTEQNAPSTDVPTFPDSILLASQNRPFYASNEELKYFRPTEEIVEVVDPARGINQTSTGTHEDDDIPSEISTQGNRPSHSRDLGPRPLTEAQSPSQSSAATFQLALEPAVALHLIEMFGPFAGVDFQEDIRHEDLIIDVDNSLARQLYKKWEKSIQMRKGISAVKGAGSQRANREPTGVDSRHFSRDQAPTDSQRSPPRLRTEPQAGTLREIMDEQLALELSRNVPDVTEQDMATKLKRQKLFEMFPGIDPVALEEVFQANRYELAPSVEAVKASCNLSGRDIPNTVIAHGFNGRIPNQEETTRKEPEEDWSWLYLDVSSEPKSEEASFQTLDEPSYLDYRAEAFQHHKLRDDCFKKAALAFSKKQGQLAQLYAQQGHSHTEKIKEANARAAALILDQKNELTDENTIDLHGLHVTEAIEALESMLIKKTDPHGGQSRKGCKCISVVTGRGNHSRGGKARIKPAILEYLKKHDYRFAEPHPGLVKVFL